MRICTLMENCAVSEEFACEHGLSLYIEWNGMKILFDMGQSEGFLANAKKLGVDLSLVDVAVLSHGHYDHGGGLAAFLEVNKKAKVYVREDAFSPCYRGSTVYIGLPLELQESDRLVYVGEEAEIMPGMKLCACNDKSLLYPIDSAGLNVQGEDGWAPDLFTHEQYLVLEEDGKRIVISGCSHKGLLNIMSWLAPDVLVGGFHFMKVVVDGDNEFLNGVAERLLAYPTTYYTCHCTGQAPYEYLKRKLGERLYYLPAGSTVNI